MRSVPWWGVVSSAAAPVLMVGGWTLAASLQPRFDPVADTVSALAAQGAADRWVMTLTFVVVGLCELLTGQAGLAERIFGAAQALWPLAVVVSCRYAARKKTSPTTPSTSMSYH